MQCPFCSRYDQTTLSQIDDEYIKSGKVRYVVKDYPLESLHANAFRAAHANHCALHFAAQLAGIPGMRLGGPVEANAVFLEASEDVLDRIRKRGWKFYTFIGGAARFMFAWDTDIERVDAFCRDLKECAAEAQ